MSVQEDLKRVADKTKAQFLARYFKTGIGEYAEGDIFIGVVVPAQRIIAKKYNNLPFSEIGKLVQSLIHEFRLTGLLILTYQFARADEKIKKTIYDFYLAHTKYINNWDLVDLSSHEIVGGWLLSHPKERSILRVLAKSKNFIWCANKRLLQ